jgi:hypothetical protein
VVKVDVEGHILWRIGSQITVLHTGCSPITPGGFLVLISVRSRVDSRDIARLEGLGQLRKPMILSGIEPATFRLVSMGPQP